MEIVSNAMKFLASSANGSWPTFLFLQHYDVIPCIYNRVEKRQTVIYLLISNSEFGKGIWNAYPRLTLVLFIYMLKTVFVSDISVEHGFKQCVEI